ncbi:DNA sulfur modification protein DndD [Enterocloster bolteae]|uniref:DNA sulfur modification protein DndD n=1 Tax=Enterocloster bolteae TaxID=208479 RepID=UPI002A813155|nr:DNA sulfur modification protein DndD [Enterocloster bolteae]
MHFTKIVLHNFGLYKGTHVLNLSPQQGMKNITLIGGMNGRGKTTILDAIFIAFYGSRATQAIQDKKAVSYSKLLTSRFNKMAEDNIAYVEVDCILEEKGNQKLKIKRTWHKKEKGKIVTDGLEVFVNNQQDLILADNWNYYVEEILPVSIARFFFFDNEKISEIAEEESFNQIKSSIKSIMGITTIDILIGDIKKMVKEKSGLLSQTENKQLQAERDHIAMAINALRIEIENIENKEKQLSKEIGKITGKIQLEEERFWQEGGYLGIQKEEFEQKKEELNLQKGRLAEKIQSIVIDAGAPLVLCENLVYETLKNCKENERAMAQQLSVSIIKELQNKINEKIYLCIEDIVVQQKLLALIEDEFKAYDDFSIQDDRFILSAISSNLLSKLADVYFEELKESCKELIENYHKVDNNLLQIKNHLNNSINEYEAKELYENIQILKDDKAAKVAELKIFEKEKSALNSQLRDLEKHESNLIGEMAANETKMSEVGRIIKYATMSLNVMDEFKVRLQRKKVADLEHNITRCFQYLVGKKNMLNKIKIDSETLDIILLDSHDEELLKSQLSAGEKQIFAVSVLWGLALSSGYQMPVVIDTPMARLDSAHRNNFVEKYLPNASNQVIVLSTDEEIYGKYLDIVKPYITACYTLLFDDVAQSSSITLGYFGEDICL